MAIPESKVCFHCKQELPISQFTIVGKTKPRPHSYCRSCNRTYNRDFQKGIRWRPIIFRDGQRRCSRCKKYLPLTHFWRRLDKPSRYQSRCRDCKRETKVISDETRARQREADRRYRAKHPLSSRAHGRAQYALKCGRLTRQPCEQCGSPESEMHHPDYSQPLLVQWLCSRCHSLIHHPGT